MARNNRIQISRKKINSILELLRYLTKVKKSDQTTALKFINDEGLDYISETIYNILYNPECISKLTNFKKKKLVQNLKPNSPILKKLCNKKYPIISKRRKVLQSGSGISLLLSAAIPFLTSLLLPKK